MHLPSLRSKKLLASAARSTRALIARGRCGLASRSDGLRRRVSARLGVVVEARLAVRFQRQICMGSSALGTAQVSALRSSEASSPRRFQCFSIMGSSIGGSGTVRSRGGVRAREGPLSEVSLYMKRH